MICANLLQVLMVLITNAFIARGTAPAILEHDLKSALSQVENLTSASSSSPIHRAFIIGGASIYSEAIGLPTDVVDHILLTRIISPDFEECDVFMPDFLSGKARWKRATHAALEEWVGFEVAEGVQEEDGVKYEFQMWVRD
jgi:dihydrofolate reductase